MPSADPERCSRGHARASRRSRGRSSIANLESHVRELRPNEDLAALEKAFRFAADRHKGQKRVSGEPYMMHPLLVTRQLADMHMDMVCLETGLLHDVVEDTTATIEEIRKNSATRWRAASTASPN